MLILLAQSPNSYNLHLYHLQILYWRQTGSDDLTDNPTAQPAVSECEPDLETILYWRQTGSDDLTDNPTAQPAVSECEPDQETTDIPRGLYIWPCFFLVIYWLANLIVLRIIIINISYTRRGELCSVLSFIRCIFNHIS